MADLAPDIPIFVDAMIEYRDHPERALGRCNYFTIAREEPDPTWSLDLGGREWPFLLQQLLGVVTQPAGAARFTTADQIEGLYALVEADERFEIELAEIWLPRTVLARREPVESGDVYRVTRRLFDTAIGFRSGFLLWETFVSRGKDMREDAQFSPEETAAFRSWCQRHDELARAQSPKSPSLALRHRPGRVTPR